MSTRRSERRRAAPTLAHDHAPEEGSDEEPSPSSSEHGDSEDDWQPEAAAKRTSGAKVKRRSSITSSSEEEDSDGDRVISKAHSIAKRRKVIAEPLRASAKSKTGETTRADSIPADRDLEVALEGSDEEVDPEEERRRMQKEAEEAWAEVRAKKAAKAESATLGDTAKESKAQQQSQQGGTQQKASKTTLNSWLGLPSITWPTSPESARVSDRDSLFIGFVYPIASSSTSTISQHIQHLGSVVHPTLPSNIFPPAFSHLDPKRRGASHDMHAWRVLELKRGRNGLGGPNDYGVEEGQDDDGERWGGDKILRAMKEMGAVDLLVIVSRWYGGTNLGPVRFDHILQCAREAIRAHMREELVSPLRDELQKLDTEIAGLRRKLASSVSNSNQPGGRVDSYPDLDVEKANRLINARKKAIELLSKRLEATQMPASDAAREDSAPDLKKPAPPSTTIPSLPSRDTKSAQSNGSGGQGPGADLATDAPNPNTLAGWDDLA